MSNRKHINPTRTMPNSLEARGQAARGASLDAVVVDRRLLEPLQLQLDPSIHATKVQEKEQIKTLNDRFVSVIDKMRHLEQQNKILETKLRLLQSSAPTESNTEPMFRTFINMLRSQLNSLQNENGYLTADLKRVHSQVEENQNKYEEEINKRYSAENEFVCLKKDADSGYLAKCNLEEELSGNIHDLDFLKSLYAEELREMKEQLKDTSVVVEMDNSRQLDMDEVVKEVKRQYEEVSARSWQEAKAWYKKKFELESSRAEQHSSALESSKSEIAALKRRITKLQSDVMNVKGECGSLDGCIAETSHNGEVAVSEAKQQLKELTEALQKAKQDMARQIREYQHLMNIKLGLDIEIATYKKLLEGEEERIGQEPVFRAQTVPNPSHSEPKNTINCVNVVIKVTETQDYNYISTTKD